MKFASKILILASVLLIACGGVEGTLNVTKSYNLKDRKGKAFEVKTGQHQVNLSYKESKNRLTIKFNDTNETVEMNTTANFTIPENGHFELRATESGQEVDILGDVQTKQVRSGEKYGREQCQYTSYEPVCSTNAQGQTTCFTQAVPRWGWQDVRYYDLETHQTVSAQFAKGTAQTVGDFHSHNVWAQKQITYQGICGQF